MIGRLFKRIKIGISIANDSVSTLISNPQMLLFLLLGTIIETVGLIIAFILFSPLILFGGDIGALIGLIAVYTIGMFLLSLFTGAVIFELRDLIRKENHSISFKRGFNESWKKRKRLFKWSVINSTVKIVLDRVSSNKRRGPSRFIRNYLGFVWRYATVFIMPVIMFENNNGIIDDLKSSGRRMLDAFGEAPVGFFIINILSTLLFIFPVLGFIFFLIPTFASSFGGMTSIIIIVGVILYWFLITEVFHKTLHAIVRTKLYLYTEGEYKEDIYEEMRNY